MSKVKIWGITIRYDESNTTSHVQRSGADENEALENELKYFPACADMDTVHIESVDFIEEVPKSKWRLPF